MTIPTENSRRRFLATNTVYVTALNVVEVCKISDDDADRRKGLLSFLYRLAADVRPLEVPNEHLINLAKGYHNGDSSGTAAVGQKTEALWHILQAPGLLVKHGPEYFTAWSGENEDGLLEAHAEARPHLQRIYSGGAIRPTSAAKCIKAFLADRRELTDFLSPMYEYSTGTPIEGNAIEKFLDAAPPGSSTSAGGFIPPIGEQFRRRIGARERIPE